MREPVVHTQTLHSTAFFSTWPMKPLKGTNSEVCCGKNVRETIVIRAKGHVGKLSFFLLPTLKHLFLTEVVRTVNQTHGQGMGHVGKKEISYPGYGKM